jgi:hypothetical protein
MFKKIHSNRDPRDTLYSEIRREFGTYFSAAGAWLRRVAELNPRLIFSGMISLMVLSIIISIIFFQFKPVHNTTAAKIKASPVQDGFDQIIDATAKLKRTLEWKHLIDSLSSKKVLNAQDSIALDSALNGLQSIRKTIK